MAVALGGGGRWVVLAVGAALLLGVAPLSWGTLALVGTAALLLTLTRAEYGLYLLVLAVPFGTLQTLSLGSFEVTGVEAVVLLAGLGWVLRGVADRQLVLRRVPLLGPALLLLLALAFSSWSAANVSADLPGGVAPSLKELLKWGEFLLVYFLAANVLRSGRQVAVVLGLLLLAGAAAALYGWYQFLLRAGPEGYLVGGYFLRAYGTFGQPNPFAGYLGMTLALTFGAAAGWLSSALQEARWRWLAVGAALAMLGAVFMTLSRGAWLGLLVSGALMVALNRRRGLVPLLGVVLLALAVALAGAADLMPSEVAERLGGLSAYFRVFDASEVEPTPENWAVVERMANWQAAWGMFMDRPWLGVGVGNFTRLYPDYALPYWKFYPAIHAHNYYLNLLAETGIVGLTAYLVLIGTALAQALRLWLREGQKGGNPGPFPLCASSPLSPVPGRGLALGMLGVLVYLSTHSLFDDLYVHGITAQLALFLGMLSGVGEQTAERELIDA